MKTIKVRQTKYAGHCGRSRDELISDVLLWTRTCGQVKAGRSAWTYIQQLCEDTGCSPEDQPEAMNVREKSCESVWDIRAGRTTRWWVWIVLDYFQPQVIVKRKRFCKSLLFFFESWYATKKRQKITWPHWGVILWMNIILDPRYLC